LRRVPKQRASSRCKVATNLGVGRGASKARVQLKMVLFYFEGVLQEFKGTMRKFVIAEKTSV
jgi:hypothetical protein